MTFGTESFSEIQPLTWADTLREGDVLIGIRDEKWLAITRVDRSNKNRERPVLWFTVVNMRGRRSWLDHTTIESYYRKTDQAEARHGVR